MTRKLSSTSSFIGSRDVSHATSARNNLPRSLQVFAFFVPLAFVVVVVIAPTNVPSASAETGSSVPVAGQSLTVVGQFPVQIGRDSYTVTKPTPIAPPVAVVPVASSKAAAPAAPSAAPVAAVPAGDAQQIAYAMLQARGWGADQFSCLVSLWNRESHWSTTAGNSSGAYGIPQSLPGSKMASAGPNWQTDATTQITWGLGYISGRYGTPCGAWAHSQSFNWY